MMHQAEPLFSRRGRRGVPGALGVALVIGVIAMAPAFAAETYVRPGVGTLAAAIAAASPGDTLLMENGTYSGAATVDKSLTIRSLNAAAVAMIADGTLTVDAPNGEVVIQGMHLAMHLDVNGGADVKILESNLYNADIDVTDYKTSEGDGRLYVIGNRLHSSGSIGTVYSDDAYVAGNTLDNGQIKMYAPGWIVGNEVSFSPAGNDARGAIFVSTAGGVQVIGNRVYASAPYGSVSIDAKQASMVLIAGNIVKLPGGPNDRFGIRVQNTAYPRVFNNLVSLSAGSSQIQSYNRGITADGHIAGNIVNGWSGGVPVSGRLVEYNLCFNNASQSCGEDAVLEDPQFVDTDDYQLAAGSPAIDAGPESPLLADIDRTRNDMGAHGGPWSIGQYDAQRDPDYSGPFVYPLFDANASLIDADTLQVRALGVARLR